MKKKLAVLAITLAAVVSSYGADEAKKDVVSLPIATTWDFTGSKVDFKAALYDTRTGAIKAGKEELILEKKADILRNNLEKNNLNGMYTLYYMKPGHFEGLTRESHSEYVKEYTKGFDKVCYESWDDRTAKK